MNMENTKKVCLCKAVLEETVKEAIRQGALTVEKVSIRIGAATGACKGTRCKVEVQNLINAYQKGEWK